MFSDKKGDGARTWRAVWDSREKVQRRNILINDALLRDKLKILIRNFPAS